MQIKGKIQAIGFMESEIEDKKSLAIIGAMQIDDKEIVVVPSFDLINVSLLPYGIGDTEGIKEYPQIAVECFFVGKQLYTTEAQLFIAKKNDIGGRK